MKPSISKGLLLLLTLLTFPALAQQQSQKFSLTDALDYAYEHNTKMRNGQLNVADAEAQILENRSIGLPQLSANLNYRNILQLPVSLVPAEFFDPSAQPGEFAELQFGVQHNFDALLDLSWLALDGSYFIGLKAANTYRDFTKKNLVSIRQEVKNDVIQAYLPALIIRENEAILEKNIANLNQLLFETKALYKEGFVEQLDVDRLELSLANLEVDEENLNRQKATAINYLKFTIGYPITEKLEVTDDINTLFIEASEEELTASVDFLDRPEYIAANVGLSLNELNVKRFQAMYYPTLRFFGSHQRSMQGEKFSDAFWFPITLVGAEVNIPIFDGLYKKAVIQRAKLELEMSKIQVKDLERTITLEVQNARMDYLNSRNRANNRKKTLDLAQKIYDTTQIKYKEGVGSSLELTTAEQGLYEAQMNYTQSLFDLLVAKANLDQALGK